MSSLESLQSTQHGLATSCPGPSSSAWILAGLKQSSFQGAFEQTVTQLLLQHSSPTSSASHNKPKRASSATDFSLRCVCKLQAWIRGCRARRVLRLAAAPAPSAASAPADPSSGSPPMGQARRLADADPHSMKARAAARQAARSRRNSLVRSMIPTPPPPTAAAMLSSASVSSIVVPARRPATPATLTAQASAPNLSSVQRPTAAPAANDGDGLGGGGGIGAGLARQPLKDLSVSSSGSMSRRSRPGSGRTSPSNTLLSPDSLAAESVDWQRDINAALTYACVPAMESRLDKMRRAAARPSAPSQMSAAQLLEEKKMLKRELTVARERHQPMSLQAQSKQHNSVVARLGTTGSSRTATATTGSSGANGSAHHSRARSLSPAPGAGAGAAGGGGGPWRTAILCESCPPDADWRVAYHPLLLQYKLVNAALQSKGMLPTATAAPAPGPSSSPSPSPSLSPSASPSPSGSPEPNRSPSPTLPGVGSGPADAAAGVPAFNLLQGPQSKRLAPMGASTTGSAALPTPSFGQAQSQPVTIARAVGVRRSSGSSPLLLFDSGSGGGVGSLPQSFVAVGGAPGSSSSTPVSRVSSRSSSPVLGAQSGAVAGAGVGGVNKQFEQWSLQSALTMQQAHQHKGGATGTQQPAATPVVLRLYKPPPPKSQQSPSQSPVSGPLK